MLPTSPKMNIYIGIWALFILIYLSFYKKNNNNLRRIAFASKTDEILFEWINRCNDSHHMTTEGRLIATFLQRSCDGVCMYVCNCACLCVCYTGYVTCCL